VRQAFIKSLVDIAEGDPRVVLLTGDLGYLALEPFSERFSDRFFNVGVAEQNMVGLATGLAEAGYIPFVYSIATFAALRPYEFIRHGPIHHRLPIRIVGVGGGFEYGHNGVSHHALEDVGVMRIQPGISVIAPADAEQASAALAATWELPGPVYYRIGKNDNARVPGLNGRFELGCVQMIGAATDVLFITMGAVTAEAVAAADALRRLGVSCAVAVVSSLRPKPDQDLAGALTAVPVAIAVEAHYIDGGVGSLVAEIIAERSIPCRLVRCGVAAMPGGITGSESYYHREHGLSAAALVETALHVLQPLSSVTDSRQRVLRVVSST
jgi:transketolase